MHLRSSVRPSPPLSLSLLFSLSRYIHPSIRLSIRAIRLPIYPSAYLSYLSAYLFEHPSIHPPIYPGIVRQQPHHEDSQAPMKRL